LEQNKGKGGRGEAVIVLLGDQFRRQKCSGWKKTQKAFEISIVLRLDLYFTTMWVFPPRPFKTY